MAEVTEVGIERLRAGHGEEDRTERDEADHAVMQHERHRKDRVECVQHLGVPHDLRQRRDRDHGEPHAHHRAEERGDARGAARLHREQDDQDHHRERDDVGVEGGGDELDAFDRGQHRKRRGDDGIAVEQRAADDAEQHDRGSTLGDCALRQRHQGQRPALAIVVGTQQDHDIFQRHDDDQRPQDQREHAEHRMRRHGALAAGSRDDGFAQRIQRAGTDVAIHDTDAAEHQRLEGGG
ncbi:hypothetical protein ACVWY2_000349 [Bradyrhizobium sp. JR6.1]